MSDLSPAKLLMIAELYKKNNLGSSIKTPKESFDDFCFLMTKLDPDQQDLMLILLEDYLRVGLNDYLEYIANLFNIVGEEIDDQCKICFLSLTPENKKGDKSSNLVLYLLKALEIFKSKKVNKENLCFNDAIGKINRGELDLLILVDDFIGSGETAVGILKKIIELGVEKEKLTVVSLVAQTSGINEIMSLGVKVYSHIIRGRGITDSNKILETKKNFYKDIMIKIEGLIGINFSDRYSFGYKKTEALVTMMRTPNNTFPIFWKPKGAVKEGGIRAPFPMYKEL
jgi:hypothetical protein